HSLSGNAKGFVQFHILSPAAMRRSATQRGLKKREIFPVKSGDQLMRGIGIGDLAEFLVERDAVAVGRGPAAILENAGGGDAGAGNVLWGGLRERDPGTLQHGSEWRDVARAPAGR